LIRVRFPALFLLASLPATAAAQSASPRAPHQVKAWEAAAVTAGVALSWSLDQGVRNAIQRHRTAGSNDVASMFRRMGQPEVFGTVALGTLAAGLIARKPSLTRAGLRISGSIVLATLWTGAGKLAFGRSRPFESPGDPFQLEPFSGHDSFPSGHTTFAFALAASLSNEIRRPWASALLYAAATGTGWSRMNDDRHWLSDVLGGAAVAISSAQFIGGRWTIFHLRPPGLFVTPAGTTLGWTVRF